MNRPLVVTLAPGGDVARALRRFRRAVDASGVLADLKRHRYHLTRAERRRLKQRAAAHRRAKRTAA